MRDRGLNSLWAERSLREQVLLSVLAVIIGSLTIWYLAVSPILEFRTSARSGYVGAVDRYRSVSAGLARYEQLASQADQSRIADPRSMSTVIAESAANANLNLARIVPDDGGQLNIWLESADPDQLMGWLLDLQGTENIHVVRASLDRQADSLVRAQILLVKP